MALWVDEMDAANRADMAAQREMRELRIAIATFLDKSPSRARQSTLDTLSAASAALGLDIGHIDAVWD